MIYKFYRPYKSKYRISINGEYLAPRGRSSHLGIDYVGDDKNIYAIAEGKIIRSGFQAGGAGNFLIMQPKNFRNIEIKYFHLNKVYVKNNQFVTPNTILGTEGATGKTTGSHLHLEIRINNRPNNPEGKLIKWLNHSDYKESEDNIFLKISLFGLFGFLIYKIIKE